jgi:alpha-ribazole phosphatase
MAEPCTLWAWRHPKPQGAAGRCIGRTDLPVDPRRAKRLAHRILSMARREQLPREVWTSPLARGREVGLWLARQGFRHRVDVRLSELDFGRWDGLPWSRIVPQEVAQWEADFLHHRPGGSESLAGLMQRVREFLQEHAVPGGALLVVGHAGWMQAAAGLHEPAPCAATWPPAPAYGTLMRCVAQGSCA